MLHFAAPVEMADVNPALVNGTAVGEELGKINRDVKDHILFEIATEVANRGGCLWSLVREVQR